MTGKNNNSLLRYTVTNEDYTFFYRDKTLFKSIKNSPFLCLSMEKEGVRKLLPFNEFEITSEEKNHIEMSFFTTACVVKLLLRCDENSVYFTFTKIGKTDERLYIRLFKKSNKTVGLGLNEKKDFERVKLGVLAKLKEKKKDKVYFNLDNTLNFYMVNSYYFANGNMNDWQVEIGSAVTVSSAQETIEFRLEFNKRFSFLPQVPYKILKTTIDEQAESADENYDAFIVDYDDKVKTPYIINKIRRNKGIFIRVSPLIDENTANTLYNKATLVNTGNGYVIDVTDEDNLRVFSNYLRNVLDLNPDGIYVDEKNIKIPENVSLKTVLFYENFHALFNKIKAEYPEKFVIFNKLNSSDNSFEKTENEGTEQHDIFLSYKNNLKIQKEIYAVDYDEIKKKEHVYINSLLFSGYKAYFYECGEHDVAELLKQGKIQLIVDRNKVLKKCCFCKKRAKNRH